MKKGIDVSKWQGQINWEKVKAAGIQFAIIKAGSGHFESQIDACFVRNMEGAQAVGMPVGVYWYSYALNPTEARAEAKLMLKTIKGYQLAFPVWLDMEDADGYKKKNGFSFTSGNVTEICRAFLEVVKAADYPCGVYASKNWFDHYINMGALGCEKWIAHWSDSVDYNGKCALWQYTSKGTVDGIGTDVDMNYCYKDYGGVGSTDKAEYVTASGRWVKSGDGWKFVTDDGNTTGGKWLKYQGGWYFFAPDGVALKGDHKIDGVWYYFKESPGGRFKECQALSGVE